MRIWGYSESEAGLTFANLRLEYESESGANFTSVSRGAKTAEAAGSARSSAAPKGNWNVGLGLGLPVSWMSLRYRHWFASDHL